VKPWGAPDNPNLHWFGLTDGYYWINAGGVKLFEYSDAAQQVGAPPFCDYQVIRLLEDVLDFGPAVLEVVPEQLRPFIDLDSLRPPNGYWPAWRDLTESQGSEDELAEQLYLGSAWLGQRTLDSLYLSPSTWIQMWSDPENVYIQWDNRGRTFENEHAWSAVAGTYTLPRDAFVDEVTSFHARLMSQMQERIERVLAGNLPRSIRVDRDALVSEHAQRSVPLDRSAFVRKPATNWASVASAIEQLEKLRGRG